MASDLSKELERAYRDLLRGRPTAGGPWRVSGDGTKVIDSYGRLVVNLELTTTLPLASAKALARLIAMLPDVCDGDLRGRTDDGPAVRVTADVHGFGSHGQVKRTGRIHYATINGADDGSKP